ncbi:MAG: serine/threonine-protein kinase [Sandaracinaceae bacterium]
MGTAEDQDQPRMSVTDVFGRVALDSQAVVLSQNPRNTIRARPAAADLTVQSAFARLGQLGPGVESRFDKGETIGVGGMGLVRAAEQVSLGRYVALKELNEDMASDPVAADMLMREAWVLGALQHPNVMPVHDLMLDEQQRPVVALKRIEGDNWLELLEDDDWVIEQYGAKDVLEWHLRVFVSVCNALAFAHSRGILHRDVKPENVMVGRFGEVYVLDWGIAVALTDDGSGRVPLAADVDTLAGTPTYMAPEMLGGRGATLGVHTDVYLLGATLFHVLGGGPPHPGDDVMQIASDIATVEPTLPEGVSSALASICQKAMSRKPDARYETVDALRSEIDAYLHHRDALLLVEEGEAKLAQMEELSRSTDVASQAHRLSMFNLYSEARLGFRLGARMWPESDQARGGLHRTAVSMVGYLLDRGEIESATTIARQVDDPLPPALEGRLEGAKAAHQKERDRVAALEALGRELDPATGRRARLLAYAALAFVYGAIEVVGHVYRPFESHLILLAGTVGALAAIGGLGAVFRRALLGTELNRRLFLAVVVAFVGKLVLHITMAMLDRPPSEGHVIMGVVYAVTAAVIAVFHEPLLSILALVFGGAAIASAVAPDNRYLFYALASFSMMLCLLVFHWRAERRDAASV